MFADISSWWQQVALFEKILWFIAILFSFLFLLQTILALTSGHSGDMHDASDHSHSGVHHDQGIVSQFFTIKNVIAFFTMFGWVGIAAYNSGFSKSVSILLAFTGGVTIVLTMVFLLNKILKLHHSGTLEIKNAVRQVATVYLFIPAGRKGMGKIHVKVQGALRELNAQTDDTEDIATGNKVKVIGHIDDATLLVSAKYV